MTYDLSASERGEQLVADLFGKKVVILSPHADDAALSVGGALLRVAQISSLVLTTVFSVSCWTRRGLEPTRVHEISKLRTDEDRSYATSLGASYNSLGFPDAGLRGYTAESECGDVFDDIGWQAAVMHSIQTHLQAERPDIVFAPAAIGAHVDHVLVARSVHPPFIRQTGGRVVHYEDLPYAADLARTNHHPIWNMVDAILNIDAEIQGKLDNLSMYHSQLSLEEATIVARHSRSLGYSFAGEKVWI